VASGPLPIGVILGPQGLKGQFKVKPFTAAPDSLSAYGPVSLDDGRQLQLQVMTVNAKGVAIVRADGVSSRDAAEALRGRTVQIDRRCLPEPDDGELYHADLLGARVTGDDGEVIGTIVGLYDFGAGDIVEVQPARGPSVMLPFGGDRVIAVDLVAGEIRMTVPDGLLDSNDTG
jgi:16S rRNA processing protein RimM